jgi:hypothetical protein
VVNSIGRDFGADGDGLSNSAISIPPLFAFDAIFGINDENIRNDFCVNTSDGRRNSPLRNRY